MRIKYIRLNNYRQFKEVEITFTKDVQYDIHVIIGRNGTGKTNILNAVNWCLYGIEPHLSSESLRLPRLNLRAIAASQPGDQQKVDVSIMAEDGENWVLFSREEDYVIHEKDEPKPSGVEFEVTACDPKGNARIMKGDEASTFVERFFPQGIREFFFFDGERLDNYFKSATGQQISHAIFEISQVQILEVVEDNLQKVVADLRKDAGKQNPSIDQTTREMESKKGDLRDTEQQLQECERQISLAKEQVREIRNNLMGTPDVENLQRERDRLRLRVREKENSLKELAKEKDDVLFEYANVVRLYPALENALKIIKEKRNRKEIPPTIDRALLDSILKTRECICGRTVASGSEAEQRIYELQQEIKLSSEVAQVLLSIEGSLHSHTAKLGKLKAELKKISDETGAYKNDLEELTERLRKVDSQIAGYDVERIREWHRQLKNYEQTYEDNLKRQGVLTSKKRDLEQTIKNLQERLDLEIRKEEKFRHLRELIDFGTLASNMARQSKNSIMETIRKQIEGETKKVFFRLIWKKETFGDVRIDEKYDIHLIHSLGYESLGTTSAAERELLAFAFTLALHSISGFDSPILIDTPVSRVSDEQRENFGSTFAAIDPGKQVILLFTPSEYSYEVSKTLDRIAGSRSKLEMSSDEKDVIMEAL
jgi:DNA sulfur modification protein DndD